jgi:hypothetical protein
MLQDTKSVHKNSSFFYIPRINRLIAKSGKNSIHNSLKKIYLRINTEELKDFYNENYKTLKRVIEDDTRKWKYLPILR